MIAIYELISGVALIFVSGIIIWRVWEGLRSINLLDRKTNDKIRKIASVSFIYVNENNVKGISLYVKNYDICYLYITNLGYAFLNRYK